MLPTRIVRRHYEQDGITLAQTAVVLAKYGIPCRIAHNEEQRPAIIFKSNRVAVWLSDEDKDGLQVWQVTFKSQSGSQGIEVFQLDEIDKLAGYLRSWLYLNITSTRSDTPTRGDRGTG